MTDKRARKILSRTRQVRLFGRSVRLRSDNRIGLKIENEDFFIRFTRYCGFRDSFFYHIAIHCRRDHFQRSFRQTKQRKMALRANLR